MANLDSMAKLNEFLASARLAEPDTIQYHYDEASDTLFMDLSDKPQPGISLLVFDGLMVRVDRDTNKAIGLQIEDAMAQPAPLRSLVESTVRRSQAMTYIEAHPAEKTLQEFAQLIPALAEAHG